MKIKSKYKEEVLYNGAKYFLSPKDIPIKGYYYVQYYKYSEMMRKHKYVCHIILLDSIKISNYKYFFELQTYAIKRYFGNNNNTHKYDSVFYTVVEFKKRLRVIPDLSMHKYSIENRRKTQTELEINIGQMVFISPGILTEVINIVPAMQQILKEGRDYAFATDFNDALEKIDTLNYLFPDYIEGL